VSLVTGVLLSVVVGGFLGVLIALAYIAWRSVKY
jgi:hypothetical protein